MVSNTCTAARSMRRRGRDRIDSIKLPGKVTKGREQGGNDLDYFLAGTVDEVVDAWELVYRSYLRRGLIGPNPHGLHTVPQAVGPRTAVVFARRETRVVTTVSAYADGEGGLPLDAVFPDELNALREQGQHLVEIGLLAERHDRPGRSVDTLLEMMRFVFFYALGLGGDSIIVGVHPHHVKFYQRLIAFDPISDVRRYSAVRDHPVVLLQLEFARKLRRTPRYRGLSYFMEDPIDPHHFGARIRLIEDAIAGTPLAAHLTTRLDHEAETALPVANRSHALTG